MQLYSRARSLAWFGYLNRLFWLLWLALPIFIGIMAWTLSRPADSIPELTNEQRNCAAFFPSVASFSAIGKLLFWVLFAFQSSIYVVLLAGFHRMVARFARGHVFVDETLTGLSRIGMFLIAFPFADLVLTNAVNYALKATGDANFFVPTYFLDLAPVIGGVFLIALKHVIEHAIALKTENDLTV